MQPEPNSRSARLDVRLSPTAKSVLEMAAAARHKSVSEFLLENGLSAAYETLADRRVFVLDDEQWAAFNRLLDAPPKPNSGLGDLAKIAPRWDI